MKEVRSFDKEILELAKQKKTTVYSDNESITSLPSLNQTTQNQPTNQAPLPTTTVLQPNPNNNLSKEENDLLEFIYKKVEPLPFTKLAKEINISTRQLYKLVGGLKKRDLVAETQIALAHTGRKAGVLIITADGISVLGFPTMTGKGGAVHQYFQQTIKYYAERQGYKVEIEKHLGGQKTIDLSLEN